MIRARRLTGIATGALAIEMLALGWLERWDAACAALITPRHAWWFVVRAAAISHLAPWLAAAFAVPAASVAWRRRKWATLRRMAVVTVGGLALVALLQWVFMRDRPDAGVWTPNATSFPSGHVANAALLCGVAVQLLVTSVPRYWRRPTLVVGSVLTFAFVATVGWSRLSLGRHWLTDIVASMLLAAAVLTTGEWLGRPVPTRTRALAWSALALGALGLAAIVGMRVPLPAPPRVARPG